MTSQPTRTSEPAPDAAPAPGEGLFRRLWRWADRRLGPADERWAKAPVAASVVCFPALLFYACNIHELGLDTRRSGATATVFAGLLALAVAWLLPHRRSLRSSRVTFAITGAALLLVYALYFVYLVVIWLCFV
ncbi:hypothetical protein ACSNOK_15855 [Streptomyces sp. URMC 126]|uniref:hypothetical protein n=1 Tax=Streptomyces sp. URMC 126 TaxID=3423401 RepID=UPI003F195DC2